MDEFKKTLFDIAQRVPKRNDSKQEYECSLCRDTGWIIENTRGQNHAKQCSCRKVKEARRMIEQSGISMEFQNKKFENFDTRNIPQLVNAKNKAITYYQSFFEIEYTRNNSIMFCGQVGSGKTHLGTAICSNLMSQNVAVIYMPYRNAVTKIKQTLTNDSVYEREMSRYTQARVLYIDDFLKGRITESDVNIIYEIVNYRYMNNLPIIVSTEKFLDDLISFDEAIGSRIIEMCRGNIVQLQGKELNYRLYS